jgi:hypothetical protein
MPEWFSILTVMVTDIAQQKECLMTANLLLLNELLVCITVLAKALLERFTPKGFLITMML